MKQSEWSELQNIKDLNERERFNYLKCDCGHTLGSHGVVTQTCFGGRKEDLRNEGCVCVDVKGFEVDVMLMRREENDGK